MPHFVDCFVKSNHVLSTSKFNGCEYFCAALFAMIVSQLSNIAVSVTPQDAFSLSKNCEILSGKLNLRRPFSQGKTKSLAHLRDWMGQSVSLRALCPSAQPRLVILRPLSPPFFFPLPSSEIVSLTRKPFPIPSYKNRRWWQKMLRECGYYCIYAHTHFQGPFSSSLVNDAPNLAVCTNESKVSSHHSLHHHHYSLAGL